MNTLVQIAPQVTIEGLAQAAPTPLKSPHRGYYIYVTEACNLRCSYCFVTDKQNHNHLSDEMAFRVAKFVMADGSEGKEAYIHFFGGEPLIRANTIEYLAATFRGWSNGTGIKLRLGITTNGTLLTTRNCEMLKRYEIGVQLSLDGGKEGNNVHRQIMGGTQTGLRAAGAFGLVQVENYLKYFGGQQPNCRMTLTVHNLKYLPDSIRELYDVGFRSFSIIPDADCGAWTHEYFRQYEQQMDQVFAFWHTHRDISVNTIGQTMDKLIKRREPTHLCQAGKHIIGITIGGDIYPCHDFAGRFAPDPIERQNLLIGNVVTGFNAKQQEYADLRIDDSVKPDTGYECATCWAKWVCARGCPYMNYATGRDVRRVNGTYCETTRINTSLAMRWMSVQGDYRFASGKPPGVPGQKVARG